MQHDVPLREAVRAIFDACYPSEEWCPVRFEDAERHRMVHAPDIPERFHLPTHLP